MDGVAVGIYQAEVDGAAAEVAAAEATDAQAEATPVVGEAAPAESAEEAAAEGETEVAVEEVAEASADLAKADAEVDAATQEMTVAEAGVAALEETKAQGVPVAPEQEAAVDAAVNAAAATTEQAAADREQAKVIATDSSSKRAEAPRPNRTRLFVMEATDSREVGEVAPGEPLADRGGAFEAGGTNRGLRLFDAKTTPES
eukprot:715251-Prorocentrum_minimum.AAC.3